MSVNFATTAILPLDAPKEWDIPYLNLVIKGRSDLSPRAILQHLKEIEKEGGRDNLAPRWSPRPIDLDILAWGEQIVEEEDLKIPHRELTNRPFLLSLMASLQPDWRYPAKGLPYSHLTLAEIVHRYIPFDVKEERCLMPFPQMVGIVNITPDSFSDGGKYLAAEKAMRRIEELTAEGASVIDIGAQSTRPFALRISSQEEWQRLEPVLDLLAENFRGLKAKPKISLDSFDVDVIKKALHRYPLDWINDVKGGEDACLLRLVAETKCTIVINHSLTVPASTSTFLSFEKNPIHHLSAWAEKKITELEGEGISKDRIILDPGIGFGKSPFQSLSLLRNIDDLKKIGCEILIGHSRKSFLKIISNSSDRDLETVGISHYLFKKRVDYLRVHDVKAHQRSLTALALVEGMCDF